MADAYIGQIIPVAFKLVPAGWHLCDGSLLPIAQNEALYALIGTTYGGDGVSSFALPDLRGRLVVGQGQGRGLSSYALGQTGGADSVPLNASQLGAHRHVMLAAVRPDGPPPTPPTDPGPQTYLTTNTQTALNVYTQDAPDVSLSPASITDNGGPYSPHENRQPHVAINYIICTSGIFPTPNLD
jgi:microcystin-dependent protein